MSFTLLWKTEKQQNAVRTGMSYTPFSGGKQLRFSRKESQGIICNVQNLPTPFIAANAHLNAETQNGVKYNI
jgi:hypothetical protein